MPAFRANDRTSKAPGLLVQQSWWGMEGLAGSTEEKLERIAEAGFGGVAADVPAPREADRWRRQLERHGLSLGLNGVAFGPDELGELLSRAEDLGALYVNVQVARDFVVGAEAEDLLRALLERCARSPVPCFVETHRGRITQDLLRTLDYVQALPDLRLTLDLSHYVLSGEICGASDKSPQVEAAFDALLARTGALHGRVSNGQQIQIDVGPDGDHPMVPFFMRWWQAGMAHWRRGAGPGDVLPFVPELGPPTYAAQTPSGAETSDRWAQALVLKRLAEQAWERAALVTP